VRWQVQEAKQRFSEVLRHAGAEGPQFVTRHGEEVAVVLDIRDYRRLRGQDLEFRDFLLAGPESDELAAELEMITAEREPGRNVDLGDD
jgi:prevent-host-death family protein